MLYLRINTVELTLCIYEADIVAALNYYSVFLFYLRKLRISLEFFKLSGYLLFQLNYS